MVFGGGYMLDTVEIAPLQALKERTPSTVGDLRKMLGFLSSVRKSGDIEDLNKATVPATNSKRKGFK